MSAPWDYANSDSDRSDTSSSYEGTIADFDDDEFEELKNFTQEDNVDSHRIMDHYGDAFERSESVSTRMKSTDLLFSDDYCNITKTYEFKLLWWSKGTGAKYECSAWIPVAKIGSNERSIDGPTEEESIVEIPFGCIVVPGFSAPSAGGYLARMIIDDHVTSKIPRAGAPFAHPVGYELLWKDEKKNSVSFWAPIAPEGYVALGRVVTADNGKSKEQKQPSKKSFCCVREDFAREIHTIGPGPIWKPQGTEKKYVTKSDSESQVPTIYNAGSIASGGWTIRHTSKRARSGEPLEVQTKEASKFQALTKNFELNFLSGRMRVKLADVSPNLKISKLSTNDINALKNQKTEEVDPEDTLIAFSKNGPYAAITASGTDFFERKDQDVGHDIVTVDPRLGILMSPAAFVNETSEIFSLTLVKLKGNVQNPSKVEGGTLGSHPHEKLASASEEERNGLKCEEYDPNDPTYRYVWESERHFPPFGWKSPHDILDACFTGRYSLNIDGSNSTNHFPEVESLLLPKGYHWISDWEIDRPPGNCTVSNTGGWAYDAYWVTSWPPTEFKNAKNWKRRFASTRRRRWRRKIAPVVELDEANVSRNSSWREGGASSASETGDGRDGINSQTNLLLTPRMNRNRSAKERHAMMQDDAKEGKGSSWSIEVPQSGGSACIPVGFENKEQHALRFVPVSKEKEGAKNVMNYENDEICTDRMKAPRPICARESVATRAILGRSPLPWPPRRLSPFG